MDIQIEKEEKKRAIDELIKQNPKKYKSLSELERRKRRRERMEALAKIQPQYKIFFQVHKDPVKEETRQ